jgi:hypothetical protein
MIYLPIFLYPLSLENNKFSQSFFFFVEKNFFFVPCIAHMSFVHRIFSFLVIQTKIVLECHIFQLQKKYLFVSLFTKWKKHVSCRSEVRLIIVLLK